MTDDQIRGKISAAARSADRAAHQARDAATELETRQQPSWAEPLRMTAEELWRRAEGLRALRDDLPLNGQRSLFAVKEA